MTLPEIWTVGRRRRHGSGDADGDRVYKVLETLKRHSMLFTIIVQ